MKPTPTLAEVAQRAGVSSTAVSLALRDLPQAKKFNKETRQRIKDVAKELGYRTNFFVSQLRHNSSKIIMLYVSSLEDPYCASISEAFQKRAQQRKYWTMITVVVDKPGKRSFDRSIIGKHGVSAIAMVGSACDQLSPYISDSLLNEDINLLMIGRSHVNPQISHVQVDDYQGGYRLAEHVFSKGVRKSMIFVTRETKNASRTSRIDGYLSYIQKHELDQPQIVELYSNSDPLEIANEAYEYTRKELTPENHPEVIFTNMDMRAVGAMRALDENGLIPGRDILLAGYDDIWQSRFLNPPLTTVHQPTQEMGHAAADLLADILERKVKPGRSVKIPPELRIRETT